jgi:Spy/CpxP family protein refolding chaperone
MTSRVRIAAGSVVVGLALVSAPLFGQMRGMATPPTGGQPHQMDQMGMGRMGMGQMPMGQGAGRGMMNESCPMMKDMMTNMAPADGDADAQALEKVFAALGVTDAQKAQMKAVRDQHQAELHEISMRGDALKLELRQAVQSLAFDDVAVRARSAALASVMTDGALAELRIRAEAFKVLTPDQQKKAVAIQKLQQELAGLMKPAVKK